jgi:predicted ABC-class ATPase
MKSAADLRNILRQIDHRSYPAYKDTMGSYDFGKWQLAIEHVQGDPFAAPSKVSVRVAGRVAGFPEGHYDSDYRRIALQDYLLRQFGRQLEKSSFQAKGSGKSGLLSVSRPGQEVLERTACQIDETNGDVMVRFEVGFPANGRTVNSRELEKIFFDYLPECVEHTLYAKSLDMDKVRQAVELADDQHHIRGQLSELGLVAFVANGAILPRESGVSGRPMKNGVPFVSPSSMEVTMELPHLGTIKGMGIKKGITLIVGGGYHGKSTLLKALELGVYNHIKGDGREYVITDDTAMKIRAEDGRSIKNVDISMFIRNLPNGKNTTSFQTEDASGSTSQAANVMEAVEAGTNVLLIDEDTSATNFMIRDELMQRVVNRESEPITPYIDRVEELYREHGVSTVLVAGSSGAYFHKADCILQMKQYKPVEITELAKGEAASYPILSTPVEPYELNVPRRIVKPDASLRRDDRIKLKTGRDSFSINKEMVDLRYVEQLVDIEQVTALAYFLKYAQLHVFDGRRSLVEAVDQLEGLIEQKGLAAVCESRYVPSGLARPRRQEIFACINRYRRL